jgi:stage IV sporulation protein B
VKKIFKTVSIIISIFAIALLTTLITVNNLMPDRFLLIEGDKLIFNTKIPLSASSNTNLLAKQASAQAGNNFGANLKLFGFVPVKQITIDVIKQKKLVPSGAAFGIKLYTDGVIIVGMSDVDSGTSNTNNPAYKAGIRIGDIIAVMNGEKVNSNEDVANIVEKSGGKEISVIIKRKNLTFEVKFKPQKSSGEGVYKAGIWVRDSTAGIGTMTFYDPETGFFAGLGHGICDTDTGEILPLMSGDIVDVNISGYVKGEKGTPGEIKGGFVNDSAIGKLFSNKETGIYGELSTIPKNMKAIPIAMCQQIKEGPAKIYCTLNGNTISSYDITIERVNYNDKIETKNMIIRVTDKKLLEMTGGIIQGMSGSPIEQDGKLIGAVTHVFINDPTRGYGIFIENMIRNVSYNSTNSTNISNNNENILKSAS